MPTLLSVNNYYYRRGGAETVFLEHNRLFEKMGWGVIPFSMHHFQNMATPWSKYFVKEIELGRNYSIKDKIAIFSKVIYSLESCRKIELLLDKVRPNICHAHNVYHHISPAIFNVLKRRGIPTVLTLHDLKLACPAYNMLTHDGVCERCKHGKLYNVILNRCIKGSMLLSSIVMLESSLHRLLRIYKNNIDRFVVPSRFYINKMVEWGWDPNNFIYIPNFVNLESYFIDFNVGDSFIYFGRLAPEKGLEKLIIAVALAKVTLWIAGTGPQHSYLVQLAKKNKADVVFLGYLEGKDLYRAIHSAKATVLPSEWYENAPMSILESYALGRPVIGASIGGIPELILEDETGITFESGSVESLASALRKFADLSKDKLIKMGRSGREWIESNFTAKNYRERIFNMYMEMFTI